MPRLQKYLNLGNGLREGHFLKISQSNDYISTYVFENNWATSTNMAPYQSSVCTFYAKTIWVKEKIAKLSIYCITYLVKKSKF